jgi:uncharacterized membrane protein
MRRPARFGLRVTISGERLEESTMNDQESPTTDASSESAIGLISDGAYTLVIGRFPTMADAQSAYERLTEIERDSRLRIDGVVVASRDAEGSVHLGKVTEHSTKTGLKWGLVGGMALGVIFPPSILAGAVAGGALGAGIGKVANVAQRSALAEDLEEVMTPNSAGVIALVEDPAVIEVREALRQAERIVTKAVDKQVAAEIDREADRAKTEYLSRAAGL